VSSASEMATGVVVAVAILNTSGMNDRGQQQTLHVDNHSAHISKETKAWFSCSLSMLHNVP
jgi:hypothetical protein